MTSGDLVFNAFSDFRTDEIPDEAAVMRRRLRQLEDIDIRLPQTRPPQPRVALASSVVAHAVLEHETQVIELKRQLVQRK